MARLLLVCPETDGTERAMGQWGSQFIERVRGHPALDSINYLSGPGATRNSVTDAMANSDILIFIGHGKRRQLGKKEALVDADNISGSVRVVVALACLSALELGLVSTENGTLEAYLGFADEFITDVREARAFDYPVFIALLTLVCPGATVTDAKDGFIGFMKGLESLYRAQEGRGDGDATILWLAAHTNWRGVALHGNSGASLF